MATDPTKMPCYPNLPALLAELEDLRRRLAEAERATEEKSVFLATMSHEIREPMNGVLGMARLLMETPLSDEQREYVEAVLFAGQSLLTIINDILDMSRMEAGKLQLDRIDFDVEKVIDRTLTMVGARAEAKGLKLTSKIESDLPRVLHGDPGRLRQILLNLLGNAIKFTHEGEIGIEVDWRERSDGGIVLLIEIRDSGIGIPEHLKDQIFSPYAQADPSVPRLYGGSGLGLAISRKLVALMGGEIRLRSTVGVGTVFEIEVPFTRTPSWRIPAPPSGQIAGLRLLVVDPNEATRMMLDQQALGWGAITRLVETGAAALDVLARAARSGAPIEIVLIDSALPDMSGEELGRRIRSDDSLGRPQLAMIASSGLRGDAARAASIGFAAYLSKPVSATDLLSCLLRMRDGTGQSPSDLITVHSLFDNKPPVLDILLVDDNPVNCKIALIMLEKAGHHIDVASDGDAAIRAVHDKRYDLILMDVQMPGMDGLEATRRIRSMAAGAGVPIVAVTANAMRGDDTRCFDAGMDDYITKPIDRARLLSKVNQWGYAHAGR